MRKAALMFVWLGCVSFAAGQQDREDDAALPRYEVPSALRIYPQRTPKDTLDSVLKVAEKGRFDYLVAHLLDPIYVDNRVRERAKLFERRVELDLLALRESQRRGLAPIPKSGPLPDEPEKFQKAVQTESIYQAYQQLVRDVRDQLYDDPELLRDLLRFSSQADIDIQGEAASATLKDLKDRQVFFRKDGTRWYIQNQQKEAQPAAKEKGAAP